MNETVNLIDGKKVRRLVRAVESESNLPTSRQEKTREELRRMADAYRFEGEHIGADDSADRDEVIAALAGRGSQSFAQYMYGDDF